MEDASKIKEYSQRLHPGFEMDGITEAEHFLFIYKWSSVGFGNFKCQALVSARDQHYSKKL